MSVKQFNKHRINNRKDYENAINDKSYYEREVIAKSLKYAGEFFNEFDISNFPKIYEHALQLYNNDSNEAKEFLKNFLRHARNKIPKYINNTVIKASDSTELNIILSRPIIEYKEEFDEFLEKTFTNNAQLIIDNFTKLCDHARKNLSIFGQLVYEFNMMTDEEINQLMNE